MSRHQETHEVWQPQTRQEHESVLHELNQILASPHFCNSKRYPAFLRHIVENALAGRLDGLKERTLGIEVFGRSPTYDTNTDTVVRYTAGEVRKRLLLYYSERDHGGVRIALPPGSYVPEFLDGQEPESGDRPESQAPEAAPPEPGDGRSGSAALPENVRLAPGPSSPRSRRLALWVLLGVAAASVLAGVLWRSHPNSAPDQVERFWAPVLLDQHAVILCTGSVVFNKNNYSGTETANKDVEYTFVSMQNASAIAQISGTLARAGIAVQLLAAPSTPLNDLRERSVALVGGYNNPWTLRLIEPLRFHFSPAPAEIILDRDHSQERWSRDLSQPYWSTDDYAVIARFRDPTVDGWLVVAAGIGRNGTEAAAEFLTSPHYMQELRNRLAGDFGNRNIEAVLKVKVIDGKTGAPSILAVHAW
jgi:hypothetical protein